MDRHDQDYLRETEPRSAKRGSREEPTVAPPIEREHETYAGVFEEEEDERRERERR